MKEIIYKVLQQQYDALIAIGERESASYVMGAILRLDPTGELRGTLHPN